MSGYRCCREKQCAEGEESTSNAMHGDSEMGAIMGMWGRIRYKVNGNCKDGHERYRDDSWNIGGIYRQQNEPSALRLWTSSRCAGLGPPN